MSSTLHWRLLEAACCRTKHRPTKSPIYECAERRCSFQISIKRSSNRNGVVQPSALCFTLGYVLCNYCSMYPPFVAEHVAMQFHWHLMNGLCCGSCEGVLEIDVQSWSVTPSWFINASCCCVRLQNNYDCEYYSYLDVDTVGRAFNHYMLWLNVCVCVTYEDTICCLRLFLL